MFDSLTIDTLRDYSWLGYAILFIGMVFEGESVLMIVATSSRLGIISPFFVWLFAVAGVIVGDIFWFLLGGKVGAKLLSRYGKILFITEARVAALSRYLNSSQKKAGGLIFLAKYLYGFTHLTLITIGASRLRFRTFIIYTVPAAILWVSIFFAAGYVYADAVKDLENNLPRVLGGLALIIVIVTFVSKLLGRYFEKKHLKI